MNLWGIRRKTCKLQLRYLDINLLRTDSPLFTILYNFSLWAFSVILSQSFGLLSLLSSLAPPSLLSSHHHHHHHHLTISFYSLLPLVVWCSFLLFLHLFVPNSQVLRSRQSHERRTSWISKKNFIANKVLDLENLSNLENRILKSCQSNYPALLIPNIIKPYILSLFITFCPRLNSGIFQWPWFLL